MPTIVNSRGTAIFATSIYLPADVAFEARELGINRSKVCTAALRQEIARLKKNQAEARQVGSQKAPATSREAISFERGST